MSLTACNNLYGTHTPPFFDYSNYSMAITTTYFGCMSVRLKQGLHHKGLSCPMANLIEEIL